MSPIVPDAPGKPERSAIGAIVHALGHFDLLTVFPGPKVHETHTLSDAIARRIEIGDFDLPHLASTNLTLMRMLGDAAADVRKIAETIASDPALSSEILKLANSIIYGGTVPIESLHEAVVRVGSRALRGALLAVAMKDVIFRSRDLDGFANEVWRQAASAAAVARAIGPLAGVEREHAYMLGLLHDVGKIALLDMLRKEMKLGVAVTEGVVAQVFARHHEAAGAALAKKWNLSEEIAAVAGNHQVVGANTRFKKSAALASLAHKVDLFLHLGQSGMFEALASGEEIAALGVADETKADILRKAAEAYDAQNAVTAGV